MSLIPSYLFVALGLWLGQIPGTTNVAGVYMGSPVFIQNSFDPISKDFCIKEIRVNDKNILFNSKMSAIKLDFEGVDLYTPILIQVIHKDSCNPIVINPDAIFYHSIFSFSEIAISDSTLIWKTIGEKETGSFTIEKIDFGIWQEDATIESSGVFGGATYNHYPKIAEGSNKYRIKYNFPDGTYLYSREIDFHFYPEPITVSPQKTDKMIYFSRSAFYKIYDPNNKVVLEGNGKEADVSQLYDGMYIIYFNDEDPGWFIKE